MPLEADTEIAFKAELDRVRAALGPSATPEAAAACMLACEFAPFLAAVRAAWRK